jgi:hypothetical protein
MGVLLKMPLMAIRSWTEADADPRTTGEFADAVAYFRRVLGDNWNGWTRAAPLACVFGPSFQGGPREWLRLYRLIRALDGLANVDDLVRRDLGSAVWTQYVAAVEQLEFCARFQRAGRAVEIVQRDDKKSPDARASLVDRSVTIEFKALHDSEEREQWDVFLERVCEIAFRKDCNLSSIEVEYAEAALDVPDAVAETLVAIQLARDPEFRPIPFNAGRARFAEHLGVMGECRIPVAQKDDLSRLVAKVTSKWWEQLDSAAGPTLIVVRTNQLFSYDREHVVAVAAGVADVLRGALSSRAMISAMLL